MDEFLKQYGYYVHLAAPRPQQIMLMLHLRSLLSGHTWCKLRREELRDYDRLLLHNAKLLHRSLPYPAPADSYPAGHWWWRLGQLADHSLYIDLSKSTA